MCIFGTCQVENSNDILEISEHGVESVSQNLLRLRNYVQVWNTSSPCVLVETAQLLHSHCIPDFVLLNRQRSPHPELAILINPEQA
jgi:hypothetical protein